MQGADKQKSNITLKDVSQISWTSTFLILLKPSSSPGGSRITQTLISADYVALMCNNDHMSVTNMYSVTQQYFEVTVNQLLTLHNHNLLVIILFHFNRVSYYLHFN